MLVTRLHDRFNQTLEAERNVLPTLNNLLEYLAANNRWSSDIEGGDLELGLIYVTYS